MTMTQQQAEALLHGRVEELEWDEYRFPLPCTRQFNRQLRGGHWMLPPYMVLIYEYGIMDIALYEGRGVRVGFNETTQDMSEIIYADSPNLPAEWKDIVNNVVSMIVLYGPRCTIRTRPQGKVI